LVRKKFLRKVFEKGDSGEEAFFGVIGARDTAQRSSPEAWEEIRTPTRGREINSWKKDITRKCRGDVNVQVICAKLEKGTSPRGKSLRKKNPTEKKKGPAREKKSRVQQPRGKTGQSPLE